MKLHLPKGLRAALLACLLSATGLAHADYTWTGGDTITTDAWKTQGNWTLGEGDSWTIGPMIPDSNMWGTVNIDDATGSVNGLEGWQFKLNLGLTEAADLTIEGIKKLQGGTVIKIGSKSTLTMKLGRGEVGNDGGTVEVTMGSGSVFNMVMHKDKGGDATNIQLGNIASDSTLGQFNLTAGTDTQTYTYNTVNFKGTITDGVESTNGFTLHSLSLGSVGTGITLTNLGYEMQGSFTKVDTALTASLADCGKYTVRVGDDGSIKLYYVTGILPGYTWNGTEAEHVWNMSNTNWLNSDGNATAYGDINKTVFRSGTNVSTLVTIGEDITAKRVIIEDDFSFEVATGSAQTLTATDIEVSKGKALTITGDGSLTITAASLKGALKVESGTLTVTNTLQADTTVTGGTLNGNTISGDVTVTGGTVTLRGNNGTTLVQGSSLTISNGGIVDLQVSADGSGSSAVSSGTTVNINAGGTLHLTGHDMLGWGEKPPAAINLTGADASHKAVLDIRDSAAMTLKPVLNMAGFTNVSGTKFNTYGTRINASGTQNLISVEEILVRSHFVLSVDADSELIVRSKWVTHGEEPGTAEKVGSGKLIVTGTDSTWDRTFSVNGGTLQLKDGGTLGTGNITMADGTTLETSGNVILANTVTGSGALSVLADSDLNVTGSVTTDKSVNNEGSLTVTGSLTADSVQNNGTLTVNGDVTSGKTIQNDGTLTLGSGSIGFSSLGGLTTKEGGVYIDRTAGAVDGNGYWSGAYYIIQGSGTLTGITSGTTTVSVGGDDYIVMLEGGAAYILDEATSGDYYINSGDVVYGSGTSAVASDNTRGIVLNGGNLVLDQTLKDTAIDGIKVKKDATLTIGDDVSASKVTIESGKLTLKGSGIYNMDSAAVADVAGTKTDAAWAGTVNLSNSSIGSLDGLDNLFSAGSTLTVSEVSATSGSTSANISLADGTALSLSGAGDSAFNGTLSGTGNIVDASTGSVSFVGDISGWTGSYTGTGSTVKFEAGSAVNASISGKSMELGSGASLNKGATLTGNMTASAFTLGSSLTVDGDMTASSITIGDGVLKNLGTNTPLINVSGLLSGIDFVLGIVTGHICLPMLWVKGRLTSWSVSVLPPAPSP